MSGNETRILCDGQTEATVITVGDYDDQGMIPLTLDTPDGVQVAVLTTDAATRLIRAIGEAAAARSEKAEAALAALAAARIDAEWARMNAGQSL